LFPPTNQLAQLPRATEFVAALPAYALTHQTGRGRARGSIAYLSGLGFGMLATVFMFAMLQRFAFHLTFGEAALAGAFFGPFVGLLTGAWVRTGRKRRKSPSRPDWQRSH
jgi:hypothetical protein